MARGSQKAKIVKVDMLVHLRRHLRDDEHARYAFLPNCNRLRARCHQYAVARLSAQAVWPTFHDNDSDGGRGTQPLALQLTADIGDGRDGDDDYFYKH